MKASIRQYIDTDQKAARSVVLKGFKDFGFKYTPQYDFDLDDPKNITLIRVVCFMYWK